MNKPCQLYYAFNQLLIGKKFNDLPTYVRATLTAAKCDDLYKRASEIKQEELSELESVLLNLLRTPDYAAVYSSSDGVVSDFATAASVFREELTDPALTTNMFFSIIRGWTPSIDGSCYAADGVMFANPANVPQDLTDTFRRVASMRIYGTTRYNDGVAKCVQNVARYSELYEDCRFSEKVFHGILNECLKYGISLQDIGKCALYVTDMDATVRETGIMCGWQDHNRDNVFLVIPRGANKAHITKVVMPTQSFFTMFSMNRDRFSDIYCKGDNFAYGSEVTA